MKGVAKLNKKLGPLGMIAMSIAMPYALRFRCRCNWNLTMIGLQVVLLKQV